MALSPRPRPWRRRWFPLALLGATALLLTRLSVPTPLANDDLARDAIATADVAAPRDAAPAAPVPKPAVAKRPAMSNALHAHEAETTDPFVELGALDSQKGEALDAFLVRVAQAMDLFTRTTHHEACGVILVNARHDAWRVRMTTNRSHISCVMVAFDEPGYTRLGPDIHSHPRVPGGIPANVQDIARNQAFVCGHNLIVFDETFSERDLDRGPGYLVSRNRLMFQRGRAHPLQQRAVFASIDEMPTLAMHSGERMPAFTGATASDALPTALGAVWANQDAAGVPTTACPDESVDGTGAPANPESAPAG